MAVRDIASHLDVKQIFNAAITSDTDTTSLIVDTANYEAGLMFAVGASAWTDGAYAISVYESDASDMTGATAVPVAKLNGNETAFPTIGAAIVSGAMSTFGIFSNLRYVRMTITSTDTTSGATLLALAIQGAEVVPV